MTRRFEPAPGYLMLEVPDDMQDYSTSIGEGKVVRGGHHDYGPTWDKDGKRIEVTVQVHNLTRWSIVVEDGRKYLIVRVEDVCGKWEES